MPKTITKRLQGAAQDGFDEHWGLVCRLRGYASITGELAYPGDRPAMRRREHPTKDAVEEAYMETWSLKPCGEEESFKVFREAINGT